MRNFVVYLKSDCYMFATLGSAAPKWSDSGAPKTSSASVFGFKVKEPSKRKKKGLVEKGEDFLKSDSHMYGSIVASLKFSAPPKGLLQCANRVIMEVSKSTIVMEDESPSVMTKELFSQSSHYEASTSLGQHDTAKHFFGQNFRSSSATEGGMFKTKPRRVEIH